ncbi:hypothetical protein Tco_0769644 [Tanacetum coccineum]|uniref:Uncharacterized protein n=1 Tax=Tanacetum coccineum TaxID=301880 RepID=A0ABQ4ZDW1_9ASTR
MQKNSLNNNREDITIGSREELEFMRYEKWLPLFRNWIKTKVKGSTLETSTQNPAHIPKRIYSSYLEQCANCTQLSVFSLQIEIYVPSLLNKHLCLQLMMNKDPAANDEEDMKKLTFDGQVILLERVDLLKYQKAEQRAQALMDKMDLRFLTEATKLMDATNISSFDVATKPSELSLSPEEHLKKMIKGLSFEEEREKLSIAKEKNMLQYFSLEVLQYTSSNCPELEAIRTLLALQSFMGVTVYQMDVQKCIFMATSRRGIMSNTSRFQVTPKVSHLHAVKRIFRYLKHQPNLGLWYPKDSPFHLEAFSDSDYAGDNHDRRSTSGGCQYLGRRLVSWQCKKQTIVSYLLYQKQIVASCKLLCSGELDASNKLIWDLLRDIATRRVVTSIAREKDPCTIPHSRLQVLQDAQGSPTPIAAHSQCTASYKLRFILPSIIDGSKCDPQRKLSTILPH